MRRYINYLLLTAVKKKGFYIIFALFALASVGMVYLNIVIANNSGRSGILSLSTFIKWMPFVFSTILVALLVLHIFKAGELDGTELLVSAKPITRKSIIVGKFTTLFILIIGFNVASIAFYYGISFADKYATSTDQIKFALSFTIGGLIVNTLSAFIIVLISSFIGKVWTIIISILYAAAFPVVSFAMIPSMSAYNPLTSEDGFERENYLSGGAPKTLTIDQIYNSINGDGEGLSVSPTLNTNGRGVKDNIDTSYRFAKYGDLWYQWGRFYDTLLQHDASATGFGYSTTHITPRKISTFGEYISKSTSVKADDGQQYYTKIFGYDFQENLKKYSVTIDKKDLEAVLNTPRPTNDELRDQNTMYKKVGDIINKMNIKLDKSLPIDKTGKTKYGLQWYILFSLYSKWSKEAPIPAEALKGYYLDYNGGEFYTKTQMYSELTGIIITKESDINNNTPIYRYDAKEYLDTTTVIIIWVVISVILGVLAVTVYMRRDIK